MIYGSYFNDVIKNMHVRIKLDGSNPNTLQLCDLEQVTSLSLSSHKGKGELIIVYLGLSMASE